MQWMFFDASALVKRYFAIAFSHIPPPRLCCTLIGVLEVVSILNRKHNDGRLNDALFDQVRTAFKNEVIDAEDFLVCSFVTESVLAALDFITRYNLNATDAIILRTALDVSHSLSTADHLIFWSSDQRLLRAANAEGLTTFDPEQSSLTQLHALLSMVPP